jgi:membrane protein
MPVAVVSGENWQSMSLMRRWWAFARYVVSRFQAGGGLQIASSLTFTTLLSMILLLAVSLAILSSFGAFEQMRGTVQEALVGFLAPSMADQVAEHIGQFLENAKLLTAPGVIALAVTAIMMLSTSESTFNRIWFTSGARPWPVRILAFWAIITLGLIMLGISISLSVAFRAFTETAVGSDVVLHGNSVVPFILQWLAFSVSYLAIPAKRVAIGHALIGGAAAAILFQGLKLGFGVVIGSGDNYKTIYCALAAIPIFLMWLYSFWTLLLIGAHWAAALPERLSIGAGSIVSNPTAATRLAAALAVLRRLWLAAGTGERVPMDDPALRLGEPVLDSLYRAGLIMQSEDEMAVAGCDFNRVPISALWKALDLIIPSPANHAARQVLAELVAAETSALQRPLADLLTVDPSG